MHMNFVTMTDEAIAAEIGRRLEQLRLERNLTQQQLADEIGITRSTYGQLVRGRGTLTNFIALLRVLDRLDLVEGFVPERPFSPLEQLNLAGRTRKHASGRRAETLGAEADESVDW